MRCVQMFLQPTLKSGYRDLVVIGEIQWQNGYNVFKMDVKPFFHRSWAHLCWSFSSLSGESKFYYNGLLLGIYILHETHENKTVINSRSNLFDAAFIFGQEQDSMRGGYDKFQAFMGDLTELGLWNYIVADNKIREMAICKDWTKGNVVAWEKRYINAHNVILKDLEDRSSLCIDRHRLVIFPQKVIYSQAKEVCAIHGGKLVIPRSEQENSKLIQIVAKHKNNCVENGNPEGEKAVWIGVRGINNVWYETNSNGSLGNSINYTKWSKVQPYPTSDNCTNCINCSYLQNDGFWKKGFHAICNFDALCTVCSITNTPVFTVKGACYNSDIDWNYYLNLDSMNQVKFFDGFKDTNLIPSKDRKTWEFFAKVGIHKGFSGKFLNNSLSTRYPIGRAYWLINDEKCKIKQLVQKITMSVCNVGSEFTCDSGTCIDINKRCDEQNDCHDGSDEKLCFLVDVPISYNKDNPPKAKDPNSPMEIHTQVTIMNIDIIDTVNMMVGITIEISMKWYDERLTFLNPNMNRDSIVSAKAGQLMWLPLDNLIHENAIIGKVDDDKHKRIRLHTKVEEDVDLDLPIENRLFKGSHNLLEASQRTKIQYNCIFHVKKFPFDEEECQFLMLIRQHKGTALQFVADEATVYNGPSIVHQFLVGPIHSWINNTDRDTKLTFVIPLTRIFTNQLLATFIPTFLLWLFGYSTLFISIENSSDRFMGAGTVLLVITMLLNAINDDLPKTSYIKLMDIWFMWHILNIFAIITYHVVIDRMRKHLEKVDEDTVRQFQAADDENAVERNNATDKINWINQIVTIVFPFLNGTFYGIYFYLTLN